MQRTTKYLDTELEEKEEFQGSSDDYNESPPNDIVAYNELRSCADLLRMCQDDQIDIQPDFQRNFVWNTPMQTRLIDSLMKQLPIPSLCISLDYKTDERLVIDGLQRIATIVKFLDDDLQKEWKLSNLEDIDSRISGKSNLEIKKKYPEIFSKVQNTVLPITVLRCNYSKASHMDYLFTIFHRLNTGGSKLSNQEIRNCIFSGPFNSFLKESVENKTFIALFNIKNIKTSRFSNEELILRFIALMNERSKYNGKLAKFLNDFMESNRNASDETIEQYKTILKRTIELLYVRILNKRSLPRLSKATTEALLIAIAKNIGTLEDKTDTQLRKNYKLLMADSLFSPESLKEGLAQKDRVIKRLNKAIKIFS